MAQVEEGPPPLSASILKNLGDRDKAKRRLGGEELQELLKSHIRTKNEVEIKRIVHKLKNDLLRSNYPLVRQGGLWGLATCSILLYGFVKSDHLPEYLTLILIPIIDSFRDKNRQVRFAAVEACYNIVKILRSPVLLVFPQLFDGQCRLSSDGDAAVQNANELLGRLVKDIVLEMESGFNLSVFVGLVKERIATRDSYLRQFLIGWIQVVRNSPNYDLLPYFPDFVDGVFRMTDDVSEEIVTQAINLLADLLGMILEESDPVRIRYEALVSILLANAMSKDPREERLEIMRMTALTWLTQFLRKEKQLLLKFVPTILSVVLINISQKSRLVRRAAEECNIELMRLINETQGDIDYESIIMNVNQEVQRAQKLYQPGRKTGLRWIDILLKKDASQVLRYRKELFDSLVGVLKDDSREIVQLVLEVLAVIATTEENFKLFFAHLVTAFCVDQQLFEKAKEIIRRLSLLLNPEKIFTEISSVLSNPEFYELNKDRHLKFSRDLVQALNVILLTSKELSELRALIRRASTSSEAWEVFVALYRSWCHNPTATLSFCLLGEAYELAWKLVSQKFGDIEVSVDFLLEIDNIVQLLESPIFTHIRLRLLVPFRCPYLVKTLYGILMLLPQSSAYEKLNRRLQCVNTLVLLEGAVPETEEPESEPRDLVEWFSKIQVLQGGEES